MPGRQNWIICWALVLFFGALSAWRMGTTSLMEWAPVAKLGSVQMLCFHATIATAATVTLFCCYVDVTPMRVRYRVAGNAEIPDVEHDFVHSGRWTTFTVWCNTLAAFYFWLVTLACVMIMQDGRKELPRVMTLALGVLWDISFPMGFLVNSIVSFVLLPAKKKNADFIGLWYMLKWRGQALHNGYVIAVALEAAIVSPGIPLNGFPVIVLYGLSYVVFAYFVFARTGVFHYFFLDPRWKLAPLGLLGLLGLLAGLFSVGSMAMSLGAHSWLAKILILCTAFATCTFRDGAAVAPSTSTSSAVA